jgi:ubiquinone/menaquinone biosynthesis C-methylase UbiE
LSDGQENRELKLCCATFYQSDLVRMLLGDVLHPGGLELTGHLGEVIRLKETDSVLDIACGRGASAIYLAEHFNCRVTGLDYGAENIGAAEAHASNQGVSHLTTFRQGDAEGLPFDDGTFDAIISECSFCTFTGKARATAEMSRVIRRGGRLGLTDVTISGPLPHDIQSLLAWVACVAGSGPPEEYVSKLEEAGFTDFTVEDQRDALLRLVHDVRRKLLGVELAARLGKLDLGGLDLNEAKRLAGHTVELMEGGLIGYTLITARKK